MRHGLCRSARAGAGPASFASPAAMEEMGRGGWAKPPNHKQKEACLVARCVFFLSVVRSFSPPRGGGPNTHEGSHTGCTVLVNYTIPIYTKCKANTVHTQADRQGHCTRPPPLPPRSKSKQACITKNSLLFYLSDYSHLTPYRTRPSAPTTRCRSLVLEVVGPAVAAVRMLSSSSFSSPSSSPKPTLAASSFVGP